MKGCSWVEHRGRRILVVSYQGCLTDAEMLEVLAEQVEQIRGAGTRVFAINDYRNAVLGERFLAEASRLSRESRTRTIEKTAVLGLTGVRKALLMAYRLATGDSSSRTFDDEQAALDWLASP